MFDKNRYCLTYLNNFGIVTASFSINKSPTLCIIYYETLQGAPVSPVKTTDIWSDNLIN